MTLLQVDKKYMLSIELINRLSNKLSKKASQQKVK